MPEIIKLEKDKIINTIRSALAEDLGGYGDITSDYLISDQSSSEAYIICKQEDGTVLSGIGVAEAVFKEVDCKITFKSLFKDSSYIKDRQKVAKISGRTKSLLAAERTALNFLQHMSGIATLTKKYTDISKKHGVRIVDTRKTKPLLRMMEKYAVTCGGGYNHRFGLFDGILIKDNHIAAAGSVKKAISNTRKVAPHCYKIEVEVTGKAQLKEALDVKADIIMLDNMTNDMLKASIDLIREKSPSTVIEVSGNVDLESLEGICSLKPDIVSVGKITHSAVAMDFSLEFE
jgi:nicotinate-nucleotide pyrophosphorylase (carboxylating)